VAPLTAAESPAQSRIGVFELRGGAILPGADQRAILDIATRASDHPLKRIVVRTLPFGTLLAQAVYQHDLSDTSLIETHLEIYRRDGRLWSPDFLASLDIRHGDWATRADLAIPELRRWFRVGGADVALRRPAAASYDELYDLLRQLDRGTVVWKDAASSMPIRIANIEDIGVSEPPRTYHIFVVSSPPGLTLYVLDAEFDGTRVTITRSSRAQP